MKHRRSMLTILFAALTTPVAGGDDSKAPAPRLALVATQQSQAIQDLLTLAEVKLSAGAGVQLLERRTLDAVLAEHKLALSGFLKSDQVLVAGKLLGVDLFALVESDGTKKQAVGMVVFDARTGVRLADVTLAVQGVEKTVDAVAAAVKEAAGKYLRQGKDLHTICLTTVRNADLPRAKDFFCDTVGHLLERGLMSAPGLALLERTRLEQVNKERDLPTGSPLRPLLASLVRIELEVGRASDGKGLRGTAHLLASDGKLLGKPAATIAGQDAHDLAAALLIEVTRALKTKPGVGTGDRTREAMRLHFEAEFLSKHNDKVRELRAREAACALLPDSIDLRNRLVQTILESGENVLRPYHVGAVWQKSLPSEELRRGLALFQRSADLLLTIEPTRLKEPRLKFIGTHALTLSRILGEVNPLEHGHTDETRDLLRKIQETNFSLLEMRQDDAFRQVIDKPTFEGYTVSLGKPGSPFSIDQRQGLTAEQEKKNRGQVLTRWLGAAEKYGMPPMEAATLRAVSVLLEALEKEGADLARVRSYRGKLTRAGDPSFALAEQLTPTLAELRRPNLGIAEKQAKVREFRLLVQKLCATEEVRRSDAASLWCYKAALEAIGALQTKVLQYPDYRELCLFMLGHNDLVPAVASNTVAAFVGNRQEAARALELADQILKHADAPKVRLLLADHLAKKPGLVEVERSRLKDFVSRSRQDLLVRFPDLEHAAANPWLNVQKLLDLQPWPPGAPTNTGLTRLARPIVHEGFVYVAALGQSAANPQPTDRYVQLLRFSLANGAKETLGKIDVDTTQLVRSSNGQHVDHPERFAVDALIDEGRYFLATQGKGILAFPLDGAKPLRLDADAGLPSGHVFAMTCVAGKLYAGLGVFGTEGYLIAHDLRKDHTTVLASSRRKDKLSPFDDTIPLSVSFFRADPKRQRALFLAKVENKKDLTGIWTIEGKTDELKRLLPVPEIQQRRLEWASPLHQDRMVLAFMDMGLVLDLEGGKLEPIPFRAGPTPNRLSTWHSLADQAATLSKALAPNDGPVTLRSGDFFHQGWLWTSFPFGRSSLDGAKKETFPSLRPKDPRPFVPSELFQAAGNRLIIADAHDLWLATLK